MQMDNDQLEDAESSTLKRSARLADKYKVEREIRTAVLEEKKRIKRDEDNLQKLEKSSKKKDNHSKYPTTRKLSKAEIENDEEAKSRKLLASWMPGSGVPTDGY